MEVQILIGRFTRYPNAERLRAALWEDVRVGVSGRGALAAPR
jgi:hypothetical protein